MICTPFPDRRRGREGLDCGTMIGGNGMIPYDTVEETEKPAALPLHGKDPGLVQIPGSRI